MRGEKAMKKSYWIRFSLLEISYWGFHASFIGFLMSYLLSKGITNTMVSIFMASYLEKNLSEDKNLAKEKILELYINTACFNNCFGLGQASRKYFNKEPKDLTLYECTLLAGVPNAPALYAPDVNMKKCIHRQNQVIDAMVKYNYIDEDTANKVKAEQPVI